MCGMSSTDGSMGVVPAMLAERLGVPQVTLVPMVETQGDQVRIKRDGDVATEVIGGTMPLVLSVTDQSGEARYPSFKGIMAAKKKPLETYSLADLDVAADQVGLSVAWSVVEDTEARPPRTAGEIVKDEDGSAPGADRVPRRQEVHLPPEFWLRHGERADPCLRFSSWSTTPTASSRSRPTSCSPSPSGSVSRQRCSSAPPRPAKAAEAVAKYGAKKVYVVDDAEIKGFLVAPKAEALQQLVEKVSPAAVLITSSPEGKEIAARLAIKTRPA